MSFIYAEKTEIKSDDEVFNLTQIYSDTKTVKCYTERAVDKHPKIW